MNAIPVTSTLGRREAEDPAAVDPLSNVEAGSSIGAESDLAEPLDRHAHQAPRRAAAPWALPLALSGLACVGAVIWVLAALRCFTPVEINYNEGWNAYHQAAFASGHSLYPPSGGLVFNNYPPLWFVLVGGLGKLGLDVVIAGRLISLLAVAGIATCVGLTARNLTKRGPFATAVGALVALAMLCACFTGYVGMNDPQFLANFVMAAALALYTSRPEDTRVLAPVSALVLTALLIKHNILAVPLTIFADVLIRSPRRAAVLVLYAVVGGLLTGLVLNQVFGDALWRNMMTPRTYTLSHAVEFLRHYLKVAFPAFAVMGIGLITRWRDPAARLPLHYVGFSLAIGLVFGGGAGTATNMYLDHAIAVALGLSVLFVELGARNPRLFGQPNPLLAAGLVASLAVGMPLLGASSLRALFPDPDTVRAQREDVTYLKARPGAAVCESLLLCYRAGRPFVYDPFNANQVELVGKVDRVRLNQTLAGKDVRTVQLSTDSLAAVAAEPVPAIRRAALDHYRPDRVTHTRAFFIR